jgi:shikimate dehydrogenase
VIGEPSPATRLLVLLGDPVSHSLSPAFQNAALRAESLDAVYLALRCAADDVPGLIRGVARAGGGGNVTVPHKEVAARAVERPLAAVTRTGACNTFWLEEGIVHGDNTDVVGFVRAARSLLQRDLGGARVLMLGAGGSARAVVAGLSGEGADAVTVVNRSRPRAEELRSRFSGGGTAIEILSDPAGLSGEEFDLVVNATSLGLRADDPLPLPVDAPIRSGAVLDLVYAPGGTPWVRAHRAGGKRAADGLEMLLHQGAAAFERWWNRTPPLEAMRQALAPHATEGRESHPTLEERSPAG